MSSIDQVQDCISWLNENKTSSNLVQISTLINRLAVLSVNIGHDVSEAYAITNELEDTYKIAFAKKVSSSLDSAAKAEKRAESELEQEKKDWTQAKNAYKRLSIYLERIDKVIESYRQSVSVQKMVDLKHS